MPNLVLILQTIKNNWCLILAGIGLVLAFVGGYKVGHGECAGIAAAAVKVQVEACYKSQQITSEVSHDYQTKIADLNKRVATLRLRPAACVSVTSTAAGRNASPAPSVNAGSYAVTDTAMIDYGHDAEQMRLQLIGCQQFITNERKGR